MHTDDLHITPLTTDMLLIGFN